ncbi:fimbria/pilus outer membrane usher protein [Acinetobacter sp. ANC 4558]|uniref:fimbria/pilus outer membrane usher protein n=1 Tax=Acinetobacter sp. ANC 4558 TaxID=1977876 RepID=UPI00148A599F|nr:fimbria/pilus outer membrane usher protein [Acinetobacter sp. ANC 4558]
MILISTFSSLSAANNEIQFNTDLLDLEDKGNIDLGYFSRPGYIMPGQYVFKLSLNHQYLSEKKITFLESNQQNHLSEACLTPDIVQQFGIIKQIQKNLQWDHDHQCLVINSLDGMTVKSDQSKGTININIPQAYLEYRTENWDPPSSWDEGINGLIFDYNVLANTNFKNHRDQYDLTNISANGVLGLNVNEWRVRANWQTNYLRTSNHNQSDQHNFHWDRFYAYRALKNIKSQLMIGENYLNSDLFDSFRFTGFGLMSDISMLPPNLRGYAPEVAGVAQSNANVVISQQGRIIYQTQVPAGPFRIQNLTDAISGTLNVKVEEQDGTVTEFNVDTASIPYLTRPGAVRYKTSIGRPTTFDHKAQGDLFATGEFSWGVSNGWSMFGGSLNSKNYNALSLGFGRDLLFLGALSLDVTQSFAKLPQQNNLSGRSYRLNYAKKLEEYNSQIQFAGYRFSEKDYLSMTDYLTLKDSRLPYAGKNKEMYTISFSKNFPDQKTSVYLNLNHQTYWDRSSRDYYNLMINRIFDAGSMRNINVSLSATQNRSDSKDYGAYLAITLPLESRSSVNYAFSYNKNDFNKKVSYYDRINERTNYQLNVAHSNNNSVSGGAYITHVGERARVTANINHIENQSTTLGANLQGGLTLTAKGVDFHRVTSLGSTRVLVDTDGIKNIPVKAYGPLTTSNFLGSAVVADVSSYYRNRIRVDINHLPEDAEISDSILHTTLTQGAIGYRKFNVISGVKRLVTLQTSNGDYLPFGTQLANEQGRITGLVDEKGLVYLSGIQINQKIVANLNHDQKCFITFTEQNINIDEGQTVVCELGHK